jgi:hypothetical protein
MNARARRGAHPLGLRPLERERPPAGDRLRPRAEPVGRQKGRDRRAGRADRVGDAGAGEHGRAHLEPPRALALDLERAVDRHHQ